MLIRTLNFLFKFLPIIISISLLTCLPLLFAGQPSQELIENIIKGNRGVLVSSDAPEEKKETVIFQEEKEVGKDLFSSERKLSELQEQARDYREQGLQLQRISDIDNAISFYQKAIALDPSFAIVYNDLGIMYETKGLVDRAEQSYLQSIRLAPEFLSPYSNLALLYEVKGDFEKAAFYWEKRVELGSSSDPWTEKAKEKLSNLATMLPGYREKLIESQTVNLIREILDAKRIEKEKKMEQAQMYLSSARKLYRSGQYTKALEDIDKSLSLDPQDREKVLMREKVVVALEEEKKAEELKKRLKQKKENIQKLRVYFDEGMKYYKLDELDAAKQVFNKIPELATSPQKE
jgi:Flp pilus assembly protein TadD